MLGDAGLRAAFWSVRGGCACIVRLGLLTANLLMDDVGGASWLRGCVVIACMPPPPSLLLQCRILPTPLYHCDGVPT